MGYNQAKHTMALISIYVFDNDSDFEDAMDALTFQICNYSSYMGLL